MLDRMIELCGAYDSARSSVQRATARGAVDDPVRDVITLVKVVALASDEMLDQTAALAYFNAWLHLRGGLG